MAKDQAHLLFKSGPRKGQRVVVPESGLRIGREKINDLQISDDLLSRTHCRFFFRSGQLWVMDEQSANGTERNGNRIGTSELVCGDKITVGSSEIQVLDDALVAGPDATHPWRYRSTQVPAGQPTSPSKANAASFLFGLAWLALIGWWLLLAYSLCLPPPAGSDATASIDMETAPPPAPEASSDSESAPESAAPASPAPGGFVAEPVTAPAVDPALMRDLRARVAKLLLSERYAEATAALAAPAVSLSADEQAELDQLNAFTGSMQIENGRIAGALSAQAGKRISLRNGATNITFKVTAVSGAKMHGSVINAAGEKRVVIDIAKLHPADRLQWLGAPTTPEANALGCVLAARSGKRDDAQQYAGKAGLLAEALQQALGAGPGDSP